MVSPECSDYILSNQEELKNEKIAVDFDKGNINIKNKVFTFPKIDKQALKIFEAGGLVAYTRARLNEE